jgi:hypothetical protein
MTGGLLDGVNERLAELEARAAAPEKLTRRIGRRIGPEPASTVKRERMELLERVGGLEQAVERIIEHLGRRLDIAALCEMTELRDRIEGLEEAVRMLIAGATGREP